MHPWFFAIFSTRGKKKNTRKLTRLFQHRHLKYNHRKDRFIHIINEIENSSSHIHIINEIENSSSQDKKNLELVLLGSNILQLYCEVIILTMDWASMGCKFDWQKLCHASCFCSSFSVNALYIEFAILLAASLASGSLSFNNPAATWTNETNPSSFIPSKPWKLLISFC